MMNKDNKLEKLKELKNNKTALIAVITLITIIGIIVAVTCGKKSNKKTGIEAYKEMLETVSKNELAYSTNYGKVTDTAKEQVQELGADDISNIQITDDFELIEDNNYSWNTNDETYTVFRVLIKNKNISSNNIKGVKLFNIRIKDDNKTAEVTNYDTTFGSGDGAELLEKVSENEIYERVVQVDSTRVGRSEYFAVIKTQDSVYRTPSITYNVLERATNADSNGLETLIVENNEEYDYTKDPAYIESMKQYQESLEEAEKVIHTDIDEKLNNLITSSEYLKHKTVDERLAIAKKVFSELKKNGDIKNYKIDTESERGCIKYIFENDINVYTFYITTTDESVNSSGEITTE